MSSSIPCGRVVDMLLICGENASNYGGVDMKSIMSLSCTRQLWTAEIRRPTATTTEQTPVSYVMEKTENRLSQVIGQK